MKWITITIIVSLVGMFIVGGLFFMNKQKIISLLPDSLSGIKENNTLTYSSDNSSLIIRDDLGNPLASVWRDLPHNVEVGNGYQQIAQITINLTSATRLRNLVDNLTFSDISSSGNNKLILKTYDFKIRSWNNTQTTNSNGDIIDVQIPIWTTITSNTNLGTGNSTIGIFTDVNKGEMGDWVLTIFGQRTDRWATYTYNVTSNLMQTDESDFIGTTNINAMTFSTANNLMYFSGVSGLFGYYNVSSNQTRSLTLTDESNFMGTAQIRDITYDATDNLVFFIGDSGVFGFYNISNNISKSLMVTDESNFIGTSILRAVEWDSTKNVVFVLNNAGLMGFYNISNNITTSLSQTDESNFMGTAPMFTLAYDNRNNITYLGGTNFYGFYNFSSNLTKSLNQTDEGNFWRANSSQSMIYDSKNDVMVMCGNNQGVYGFYNLSNNITKNLMNTDENDFIGSSFCGNMAFDSVNNYTFMGWGSGIYGYYDFTTNITKSLMQTDENNFIGTNNTLAIGYDSISFLTFIGGQNGIFGVYNITNTTVGGGAGATCWSYNAVNKEWYKPDSCGSCAKNDSVERGFDLNYVTCQN